jgi:hypothetical protein
MPMPAVMLKRDCLAPGDCAAMRLRIGNGLARARLVSGNNTANSSPPIRPTMSDLRLPCIQASAVALMASFRLWTFARSSDIISATLPMQFGSSRFRYTGSRAIHLVLNWSGNIPPAKKFRRLYREEGLRVRRRGDVSGRLAPGRRYRSRRDRTSAGASTFCRMLSSTVGASAFSRSSTTLPANAWRWSPTRPYPACVSCASSRRASHGVAVRPCVSQTIAPSSPVWRFCAGARRFGSSGTKLRPASQPRTPSSRASCIDGPADARDFSSTLDTGWVRSCIRPVSATDTMVAGPDGDRDQRVALVALKALRACSIPSSARVHHAVICPQPIRWPTYAEGQAASLGR